VKENSKIGIIVALVVCVMVVFVSPAVSLEPTALRASKAANLLLAALLLAGSLVAALLHICFAHFVIRQEFDTPVARAADLVDLNCVRRC
jgi:hypothetical protein